MMTPKVDLTDDSRFDLSAEELRRIETRWKSDVDLKLDELGRRTATIERLVWVAVGGTIVLSFIATVFLRQIERQADEIARIGLRQAAVIAERNAQIEAIKADIERIRNHKK